MRKQTLANGERYITPELKEYEAKVLNSESLIEKIGSRIARRGCATKLRRYYPAFQSDEPMRWRSWMSGGLGGGR